MSDFVQQQDTVCDFSTSDSWVILSPIEQSIKRKIEAIGTPLKNWDINIYRGVLTGCNEAFIISTAKRDEILANCQTEEERKRTEELIRPNEDIYELKLSVIENCLYGSDIQSIAAQITKLRFFISLICNCEKDASKPNFGIPTLPNLETKFVSANSLIAKKKEDRQLNLFKSEEIESIKKELHQIRHLHFSAKSTSTKHRLREKDLALREKLIELLSDENNFASDDAKQLAEWNPYDQNAVSPFFDPEWMFGVTDGFDIVIGNPPYIQLQNNGGELAKLYENSEYSTFARTGDIYCLFYERGWQLLKNDGHLCYITSQ